MSANNFRGASSTFALGDCDDKWSMLPSNSYRIFPVGQPVDNKSTLSHDDGPNKNKDYITA
jgi:hypothetical protein